jgi:hypothetical protein
MTLHPMPLRGYAGTPCIRHRSNATPRRPTGALPHRSDASRRPNHSKHKRPEPERIKGPSPWRRHQDCKVPGLGVTMRPHHSHHPHHPVAPATPAEAGGWSAQPSEVPRPGADEFGADVRARGQLGLDVDDHPLAFDAAEGEQGHRVAGGGAMAAKVWGRTMAVAGRGTTCPSALCGRRWLYSFRHDAGRARASRTSASSSALRRSSRRQHHVRLTKLADDLLGRVSGPLHRESPGLSRSPSGRS